MRMRLVGYSGDRPPVPATSAVEPIDPNPDGGVPTDPPSPLVLSLADGVPFLKADYLALGYNRFEVMCFGGSGGAGGGWQGRGVTPNIYSFAWGGKGGGGGVHRVKGRLTLLPSSTPVVVGAAGTDAPNYDLGNDTGAKTFPSPLQLGGDGGYSSFGGTICRASGGKGGKYPLSVDTNVNQGYGNAGRGGLGNSIIAGGGGMSNPAYYPAGHHNDDILYGRWDSTIGEGGGGGQAGVTFATDGANFDGGPLANTSWGGGPGLRGAYSPEEPTTSGPGGESDHGFYTQPGYPTLQLLDAIPGWGGGAKAFLLNGDNTPHGSRIDGLPGIGAVMIRLTYVVV